LRAAAAAGYESAEAEFHQDTRQDRDEGEIRMLKMTQRVISSVAITKKKTTA
jgi:hypothetical protein